MKVLPLICQQNWKTQQWPQDWKRSVFISVLKKGKCQKMFKLPYSCAHFTCQQDDAPNPSSQASIVYEPRTFKCTSQIQKRQMNQRSNSQHLLDHTKSWKIKKKKIYFRFIDYAKYFECVDHNKLENFQRREYQTTLPVS